VSAESTVAMASLLRAKAQIPDHVVHRPFPTETVVLNLQTGRYHGLNPIAGRMLEELGRGETVADAANVIATEYGQPREDVERDICHLCQDLLGRGLIEMTPDPSP